MRTVRIAFALAALSVLSVLVPAQRAQAAPLPFDAAVPYVFVAQNAPTGLFRAVAGAGGTVTFAPEGPTSTYTYNAIAYHEGTNLVYGVINSILGPYPQGSIVAIGRNGEMERVGTDTVSIGVLWSAIAGNLMYVGNNTSTLVTVIDVTTGAITRTFNLETPPTLADVAYAYGYFWGINAAGMMMRLDLESATPTIETLGAALPPGGYGAAWTYGNGNLGFSNNGTGDISQIRITDPGSATPTFTHLATSPGPASSNNDGAASPGAPTDLSIEKTGPATFVPGSKLNYTITVTNDGPGVSSGAIVTDLVPAGATGVASATPGCTVVDNDVTCTLGEQAPGTSTEIVISADAPTNPTACLTNAASVLANGRDPESDNNEASVTSCPRALAVTKTSNAPANPRPGDTITYTVTARNTGLAAYTVDEPARIVDDLTGVLDDAVYQDDAAVNPTGGTVAFLDSKVHWTGPLAPGATTTLTYSVIMNADGDGVMRNVAFAPPPGVVVPPTPSCAVNGVDPATGLPCASITTLVPHLTVTKTSDLAAITAPGQTVTYSFLVQNTGGTVLAPVTVTEESFTGHGTAPVVSCPAGAASLDPGASVTCTATYVTTQADIDAGSIENVATAGGTPPSGPPVNSPPSPVEVPVTQAPGLTVAKTADPSSGVLAAGETIEYSFLVTNTGNVTLAPVVINEVSFSGSGSAPVVSCPPAADSLAPTSTVTCTASYTLTQADVNSGEVENTATATGVPPTGPPVDSPPSTEEVTITSNPDLTVVKSATPNAGALKVGEEITYSFVVTNTGNVTLAPVTVDEGSFSGTGTAPDVVCPAAVASVDPGDVVTCTASYVLTQADVDTGAVENAATATGVPPTGPPVDTPPSNTTVTIDPSPGLTVVKTGSASTLLSSPGDRIDYRFVVTNTGNVTLAPVTVTEGSFTGTGGAPAITCPAQITPLAPGGSAICTASYVLTSADINAGGVTNTAKGTGVPPSGPPIDSPPSTVRVPLVPVPGVPVPPVVTPPAPKPATLSLRKSSNRARVRPGQTVSYRLQVTASKSGNARSGTERLCDRLPANVTVIRKGGGKLRNGTICWTIKPLQPGGTVTKAIAVRVDRDNKPGKMVNRATLTSAGKIRSATKTVRVLKSRVKRAAASHVTG